MGAVRKIEISDNAGVPKFRFDSTGLPERPVIMHQCAICLSDSVITNKDAGDLAAWLIGEAVDDAHGNGVLKCDEFTCKQYGELIDSRTHGHIHRQEPWTPSGPDDEAGTGTWGKRPAGS